MPRHHDDFITAFLEYSQHGEAPRHMYFWTAVSTIAGALRRRVWIDEGYFQWYPNMYIVLVAPPGIVSKSTTAGIGMQLLRQVPGIKFGPDVVTWPALVQAFGEATEAFEYQEMFHPMSALTLESSEFGNLLDPSDKQMVDLLVSLWDGKQGSFEKKTKGSGTDSVQNPWINLIACTTPSWIAGNFPEYMVGGGFTSRTLFVYADTKEKYVAYPSEHIPAGMEARKQKLVDDLTHIAVTLTGEYKLTPEAREWGRVWYKRHYETRPINLDPEKFGGYIARKQTHMHKLAMILAASSSDRLIIDVGHLATAETMLTDLEPDMQFVFAKLGQSEVSTYADRLIAYVHGKVKVEYTEAYRYIYSHFPSMRDFEDVLSGCIKAGYIQMKAESGQNYLHAGIKMPVSSTGAKRGTAHAKPTL